MVGTTEPSLLLPSLVIGKVLNLFILESSASTISKHAVTSLITLNYCSKVNIKNEEGYLPYEGINLCRYFHWTFEMTNPELMGWILSASEKHVLHFKEWISFLK